MKSTQTLKAAIYFSIILFAMTFIGCADGFLGQRADDNDPTNRDREANWSVEQLDEDVVIDDEASATEIKELIVVE